MTKTRSTKYRLEFYLKLFLLVILLLTTLKYALGGWQPDTIEVDGESDDRIAFAKCLMKRGMIMYGVDTCEYCQMQKKMFGRAFEEIRYINCDFEEVCRQKNITGYPVWEVENKLIPGLQTFESLAGASGCEAPKKNNN